MKTTPMQPFTKTAEIIHLDILRKQRERREQTTISAENRNLSSAWSK